MRRVRATPPAKKVPNGPVEVMKVPEAALELVRRLSGGDLNRVQVLSYDELTGLGDVVVWNSRRAARQHRARAAEF